MLSTKSKQYSDLMASKKRSLMGLMGLVPLTGPETPQAYPETLSRLQSPDLYVSWGFWDNGRVRVGYARVSRQDQRLEPLRDALLADGRERIFEEKVSSRKALQEALDYCREGDVLVVARLDRSGRSLRELIDLVGELEGSGVGFRSLKESLDTTTPFGRLLGLSREYADAPTNSLTASTSG